MLDATITKRELSHSRRTRLGTFIVSVAFLSVLLVEAFSHLHFLGNFWTYAVTAVACAGLLLSLCSPGRYMRPETPEEVLQFGKNPHYWALVFLLTAALFYSFFPRTPLALQVQAPAPALASPPPPPAPEFPDLKVSGVILNGKRSSAVIDGEIVVLGDDIHNVRLIDVKESGIVVEMNGAQKHIPFGPGLTEPPAHN